MTECDSIMTQMLFYAIYFQLANLFCSCKWRSCFAIICRDDWRSAHITHRVNSWCWTRRLSSVHLSTKAQRTFTDIWWSYCSSALAGMIEVMFSDTPICRAPGLVITEFTDATTIWIGSHW